MAASTGSRSWWQRWFKPELTSPSSASELDDADLGTGFGLESSLANDDTDHSWLHHELNQDGPSSR